MGGKSDFEGPRRMKIIVDSISELVSVRAQCYTLERRSIPVEACARIVLQLPCQRAEAPGFREGDLTAGAGKGQWRRVREGCPGRRGWRRKVREGHPGCRGRRRRVWEGRLGAGDGGGGSGKDVQGAGDGGGGSGKDVQGARQPDGRLRAGTPRAGAETREGAGQRPWRPGGH